MSKHLLAPAFAAAALTVLATAPSVSCNDASKNHGLAAENDGLRREIDRLRADLQRCTEAPPTEPAAESLIETAAYAIDVRNRMIRILTAGLAAQAQAIIPRKPTR